MTEYIKREDAINLLWLFADESCASVVSDFESLSAADVVEVRHAKWKSFHKQNKSVCTNCSFERDLDADFGRAIACPNCGARMDSDFYDSRRFLFLRPAKD